MRRTPFAVLALSALLVAAACGNDDEQAGPSASEGKVAPGASEELPKKLIFAAVPQEENEELVEEYGPFITAISEEIGIPIEFFTASDYAGVIEAQIAGRVDIAQFGPFSYVIARNNGAAIEPIAAQIEGPNEEPVYQSYGIVPKGSPIKDLAGFRGKKVCFVDPSSTSGYLYPSAGLLDVGIDPQKDVTPVFAGGHDASGIAVAKGNCEAGFAFDKIVDTELAKAGDINAGDLQVVWKSEPIANSPMAVRSDLSATVKEKLKGAVVKVTGAYLAENGRCGKLEVAQLADGTKACTFTGDAVYGYTTVDDSTYNGVRAVCEKTKSEKCLKP
jgi:phosphonate transport system substrate-binding protein